MVIIENNESLTAYLEVYEMTLKKDFWSLRCVETSQYHYVFLVSTGTIARYVQLG